MSLRDSEHWFSNELITSDTHRLIFTVSPFLILHHDTMDLGNDGMGVHDTLMNVGNDGIGVCNTPMNIRNNDIRVYRKLGLEVGGQPWPYRGDGTHVEDVKDPIEAQSPGGDRPLIVLRVENSRDCTPFTPLDDPPLDLGYSPAIANLVKE